MNQTDLLYSLLWLWLGAWLSVAKPDKIVFPRMESADLTFHDWRKPRCESSRRTWSCQPQNYPDNTMTQLLQTNSSVNQLLQTRIADFTPEETVSAFLNVCPIDTDYVFPKAAMNKAGTFMFIVNQPAGAEEYFQVVKVSICSNPDQECGEGELFSSVPTKCMQEYSDRKLVALSETGQELVVDTFSFPSCCLCMIQQGLQL